MLYEAGVAMTVAFSFAPELVMSIAGVRDARRLRGRPVRGVAGLRGMAIPVLEGALDRSLQLASSMDARGYGRRAAVTPANRRLATAGTASGLLCLLVGVYGVLDPGSLPLGGIPFVVAGSLLLGMALAVGGKRTTRTRYRPDLWRWREWAVVGAGALVVLAFVVAGVLGVAGMQLETYPLRIPPLPLLPTFGVLVGLLPAVLAPAPPSSLVAPRQQPATVLASRQPGPERDAVA